MSTGHEPQRNGSAVPMAIVLGALIVFAGFVFILILMWTGEDDRGAAAQDAANEAARQEVLDSMEIPDFSVRTQDGRELSRHDLEGRWTVLSFGFTHCTLVCPIMHGQMYRLQEMLQKSGLAAGGEVQILVISVDPANDTVERLAEYASQMQADPSIWSMARAEPDVLSRVMVDGFGFGTSMDPTLQIDLGDGRKMDNIVHSSRVLLISPEVKVVGMYRGTDPDDIDRLYGDLKAHRGR